MPGRESRSPMPELLTRTLRSVGGGVRRIAASATGAALDAVGSLPQTARRAVRACTDLVFPPECVVCGDAWSGPAADPRICAQCLPALTADAATRCPRCAERAPAECIHCRQGWRCAAAWVLGTYDGPLREAVLRTKHAAEVPLAAALGELLYLRHASALREYAADVVAPVPSHWWRQYRRGVNPPQAIAEALAARLHVPCASGLVRRLKATPPLGELSRARRAAVLRRAFALSSGHELRQANVLLVDDILTTGATANEIARVLLRHGAGRVAIAAVVRAEPFR